MYEGKRIGFLSSYFPLFPVNYNNFWLPRSGYLILNFVSIKFCDFHDFGKNCEMQHLQSPICEKIKI